MLNPPYQVGTLLLARKLKSHRVPARMINGKFPPSFCPNWTNQLSRLKGAERPAQHRGYWHQSGLVPAPVTSWVQNRTTMDVFSFLGHLPDNETCEHRARAILTLERVLVSGEIHTYRGSCIHFQTSGLQEESIRKETLTLPVGWQVHTSTSIAPALLPISGGICGECGRLEGSVCKNLREVVTFSRTNSCTTEVPKSAV